MAVRVSPPAARRRAVAVLALFLACGAGAARADEVQVAVASNFAAPMQRIAADFRRDTGHVALLAFGASGRFHAQVRNGAPFEVLLSADEEIPRRLEAEGLAVAGSRYTYAVGRLVLWSARPGYVDPAGAVLRQGAFARLAIANPKTAPYGAAAVQALRALGLYDALAPRFVQGENVAQAHQFVASGNAELGFVALAQVMQDGAVAAGSAWQVPASLHAPIRQDAVLLARGRDRPAALALLAYLRGDGARAVMRGHGYVDGDRPALPAARPAPAAPAAVPLPAAAHAAVP